MDVTNALDSIVRTALSRANHFIEVIPASQNQDPEERDRVLKLLDEVLGIRDLGAAEKRAQVNAAMEVASGHLEDLATFTGLGQVGAIAELRVARKVFEFHHEARREVEGKR